MEKVSGKLKNVIWTHPEKGVCVACYHGKNGDFTVTGSYLPAVKRATYIFDGEWIHSPKYGLQFKAASFEEHIGTDKDSPERLKVSEKPQPKKSWIILVQKLWIFWTVILCES